jgi:hypothetical protein
MALPLRLGVVVRDDGVGASGSLFGSVEEGLCVGDLDEDGVVAGVDHIDGVTEVGGVVHFLVVVIGVVVLDDEELGLLLRSVGGGNLGFGISADVGPGLGGQIAGYRWTTTLRCARCCLPERGNIVLRGVGVA